MPIEPTISARVSAETKHRFERALVERRTTMQSVIEQLVEEWIAGSLPGRARRVIGALGPGKHAPEMAAARRRASVVPAAEWPHRGTRSPGSRSG